MLLNVMAIRSAPFHAHPDLRWRDGVRTAFHRLKQRLFDRPPAYRVEGLSVGALKDIGLTPGDLPSIRTGGFFSDGTRQQR